MRRAFTARDRCIFSNVTPDFSNVAIVFSRIAVKFGMGEASRQILITALLTSWFYQMDGSLCTQTELPAFG